MVQRTVHAAIIFGEWLKMNPGRATAHIVLAALLPEMAQTAPYAHWGVEELALPDGGGTNIHLDLVVPG